MSFWQRLRQVARLARDAWRLNDPRALVVSYDPTEPAIYFAETTSYAEVNAFMRMLRG